MEHSWPEGVPRDYNALFKKGGVWEKFILGRLRTYNKVGRNLQDIYQDIALKLVAAQVLEKFVKKATTRLPPRVTLQEMLDFCAISLEKFESLRLSYLAEVNPKPIWMPFPIEGETDLYTRADVIDFDRVLEEDSAAESQRTAGLVRKTVFLPTAEGFKTYLGNAIRNHFVNFCRTKSRREKESLLNPNSIVASSGDGMFHTAGSFEDVSSWEANLAEPLAYHPDELEARLDFAAQFREACAEAGLDPDVIADYMTGLEEAGAGPTPKAKTLVDVIDHMARTGQDLPEAFERVHNFSLSRRLTRRIRSQAAIQF